MSGIWLNLRDYVMRSVSPISEIWYTTLRVSEYHNFLFNRCKAYHIRLSLIAISISKHLETFN
jgi:hypothetical protein